MLSYLKQSTALGMAQTSRVKYEHQIAKVNTHIETEINYVTYHAAWKCVQQEVVIAKHHRCFAKTVNKQFKKV